MNRNRRNPPAGHRGQGVTEYIIIVALVAIAAIGVFTFFGGSARATADSAAAEVTASNANQMIDQANKAASTVQSQAEKTQSMDATTASD